MVPQRILKTSRIGYFQIGCSLLIVFFTLNVCSVFSKVVWKLGPFLSAWKKKKSSKEEIKTKVNKSFTYNH